MCDKTTYRKHSLLINFNNGKWWVEEHGAYFDTQAEAEAFAFGYSLAVTNIRDGFNNLWDIEYRHLDKRSEAHE